MSEVIIPLNGAVRTDCDGDLSILHYRHCDESSPLETKRQRGNIYCGNDLLIRTFDFTPEYCETDDWDIPMTLNGVNTRFFTAEEGALIRVYFFSGAYMVSTHKKLNACDSYWGFSDSFGDNFKDAIEYYVTSGKIPLQVEDPEDSFDVWCFRHLNPSYSYVFLLRNNYGNRMVCRSEVNPTIYHAGTFDRENGHRFMFTDLPGIERSKELFFTSKEEIVTYLSSSVNPRETQGIVAYVQDDERGYKQMKVVSKKYKELSDARGNESSVIMSYLKARMDDELSSRLYSMFPEYIEIFQAIEKEIIEIGKKIIHAYVNRYIHKKYVVLPKEQFMIMDRCHKWHVLDRNKNKISDEKVLDEIDELLPLELKNLIISEYPGAIDF